VYKILFFFYVIENDRNFFVEKPGVIQLKERCLAYDRRYVKCTFRASTIARAFRNGFPRLYQFQELNYE
jgi:hypothetical protein